MIEAKRFASLISFLSVRFHTELSVQDIEIIYEQVDNMKPAPAVGVVSLDLLFKALLDGSGRIEAVKQHRVLTGLGLRESLAAVDSIRNRLTLDI